MDNYNNLNKMDNYNNLAKFIVKITVKACHTDIWLPLLSIKLVWQRVAAFYCKNMRV